MTIHRAANLQALPRLRHGFFDREGGVSAGLHAGLNCGRGSRDDPAAVAENRAQAAAMLAPGATLVTLAQIHSAIVHTVDADWDVTSHPKGDAMVTATPGMMLGILTADCAPVLLADDTAGVIGAAHAGWKGALGKDGVGVLEATIAAMEELGADRTRIAAAIGPAIAQSDYEVGADFRACFTAADARFFSDAPRADHWRFDLAGYVAHRLGQAGVGAVRDLGLSTYAPGNGFFSFRRATHAGEADYGRQISAIMLAG